MWVVHELSRCGNVGAEIEFSGHPAESVNFLSKKRTSNCCLKGLEQQCDNHIVLLPDKEV